MGLLDRIQSGLSDAADYVSDTASNAVDTVQSAASDVVDTVAETATEVVQSAEETAAAAATQFQGFVGDAGALARQVSLAPIALERDLTHEVRGFLCDVGDSISSGGRRISEATDRLQDSVSTGVTDGLRSLGSAAEEIGRDVAGIRDDVANGLRDLGQRALDTGEGVLRASDEAIDQLRDGAQRLGSEAVRVGGEALDEIRGAGERLVDMGRGLRDRVVGELDPDTHLQRLDSEGDSVKVRLGGFARAQVYGVPVHLQGAGELEARRTADGYEVDVSGQAGIGLYATTQRGELDANARLQGGAKVTMRFAVPPHASMEEAREAASRAMGIVGREAAVTAASQGPAGLVTGMAARAAIGPSQEDYAFLQDSMSAVELRGGLAADVAGELPGSPLSGDLAASAETAVRLEFPRRDADGNVTRGAQVIVSDELNIRAQGMLSEGGGELTGGIEGKVTRSRTYQLPPSATGEALLRNPLETVRSVARDTTAGDPTLTIEGQVRGGGGVGTRNNINVHAGGQVGGRFQVQVTGSDADLQQAALRAARGDIRGALGGLSQDLRVSGEVAAFANTDVNFSPGVKTPAGGVGIEAQYQHHDRSAPVRLAPQSPAELWASIERQLEQVDVRQLQAAAAQAR